MTKIKTYNLTFWLPFIVSSLFASLFLFQIWHGYQQDVARIYQANEASLKDSAWHMSRTLEYNLANKNYDQAKREIVIFALRDQVEFSALLSSNYIIELASSFAWQGQEVQKVMPDIQELLEHALQSQQLISQTNKSVMTVIVPVVDAPGSSELRSQKSKFLVLRIDLARELKQALSSAVSEASYTLFIIFLFALLLIEVIRQSVLVPLRALNNLSQQLLQNKNLINPLSGNTEQTRVAQVLVDAGNRIRHQLFDLQDKEQRLSVTLNSIGDAVIVTDQDGFITRINKAATAITGWTQEQAFGLELPVVFDIYNASTNEKVINPVEQVLATKQVVELANHTVLVSKTGERFHISDSAAPIRYSDNESEQILGVILVFQNVTPQYKLREQLRQNAEFLAYLLDVSPGVTYVLNIIVDSETSFLLSYINNAIEEYSGNSATTWLSHPDKWLDRVHPDDVQQVKQTLYKAIESKKHVSHEFRLQHHQGHYITVRDSLTAVFDGSGAPYQIVGVFVDISDEIRVIQQQQFLGEILERSLNEIYVFDAETFKFTQVNQGARQNLGYSLEELRELTPVAIKPEFSQAEFEQFIAPLKTGEAQRLEFEAIHQRKDGSTYPVAVDLQLDQCSEQSVFVAIADDMTQRKIIEQALSEERALLKGIIDSTPDLIFCKDPNGVYLRCNKAFEAFYGAEESDILGKTDFDFVDQETAQFFRSKDKSMLDKGVIQINEEMLSFPDGHTLLFETLKAPLKTDSGSILGVLGISRDITLQRQTEQALKVAGQVFESSNEGILVTDARNAIIQVNPAFTKMTGYTAQEVIGKDPQMLSSGSQDSSFYHEFWQTLNATGSWSGELINQRKNGETYPQRLSISTIKDDAGAIQKYVAIMSDFSVEKEAQERIEFLAQHDDLTLLPNRVLLNDRIHQALITARRQQQSVALLFLDLDRFKFVNDSLGHAIGDKLLIEVAQILSSNVRQEDTVSRTGGDEFTILLVNTNAQGAAHVAQILIDAISEPFTIENHPLFVTLSIGISLFPDNGKTEQVLSQKADNAMYRAKQSGRNQYQFFTEEMHTQMMLKLELEKELRYAQERQQLELVYQPQLDLKSNKIIGCEALIRWNHPDKGYISPMIFIPIAEESGLINSIGDWVLMTAMQQMQQWNKEGYTELLVAVNLSGVQFNSVELVDRIQELLQIYHLSASNLELEITESIAMRDIDVTISQLQNLSSLGIKLSLDDFGTGYSSLSYLKKFPINKLKIDQSFVFTMLEDEDNEAIVEAIITLAKSLRLETIAEGVETKAQLDTLKTKGCDQIQGYYFSKPISAQQFSLLMERHS
ncbi:MAG: PAS domain S-box protein [Methylococcaceae bacterium]|nr:PAS domain S-box protein [Methylococcaceae bacterium]